MFQRPGLEAVQHHLLPLEVLVDRERRTLLITRGPIAEMRATQVTLTLSQIEPPRLFGGHHGLRGCLEPTMASEATKMAVG